MNGNWDDKGRWVGGETQDWSKSLDTDTVAQGVGTLVGFLLNVGFFAVLFGFFTWIVLLIFGVI